jgi:hypothetical protein
VAFYAAPTLAPFVYLVLKPPVWPLGSGQGMNAGFQDAATIGLLRRLLQLRDSW